MSSQTNVSTRAPHLDSARGNNPAPSHLRGPLGGPQRSGELQTLDPRRLPFKKSGTHWNPINGDGISGTRGAFDESNAANNIDRPLVMQFLARPFVNGAEESYIVKADAVLLLKSASQSTGRSTILNIGCFNILSKIGYMECKGILRYLHELNPDENTGLIIPSEADLFGGRYYKDFSEKYAKSFLDEREAGMYSREANNVLATKQQSLHLKGLALDRRNEQRKVYVAAQELNETAGELMELASVPLDTNIPDASSLTSDEIEKRKRSIASIDQMIRNSAKELGNHANDEYKTNKRSIAFFNNRKDLSSEGLRYMYAGSMSDLWNFLGFVKSSANDPDPTNPTQNTRVDGRGLPITVAVERRTHACVNLWGSNLNIGDKLFFLETRVKSNISGNLGSIGPTMIGSKIAANSNVWGGEIDGWGEFQLVPFSNGKNGPTLEDLTFVDVAGRTCVARAKFVGTLAEGLEGKKFPKHLRNLACGLVSGQTAREAFDAAAKIDKICIHQGH